jgi:hypothetical protein
MSCDETTNCYCFSASECERNLGGDTAGAKEVAFGPSDPMVVREWSWVLPVAEPDTIVVWTST